MEMLILGVIVIAIVLYIGIREGIETWKDIGHEYPPGSDYDNGLRGKVRKKEVK